MPSHFRFHLDQDGHSVTVEVARPSGTSEVLVDGKVVAHHRGGGQGPTVLEAELPGDPPQPISITVDDPPDRDAAPLCLMDIAGMRYVMPLTPLTGAHSSPPARTAGRARRLRRLRRHVRRIVTRLGA
ncbi:hypothetical protein H1V43_12955 [Streptomyces sp. PSKA54]|uniref:Uncharacterized protein n=1 Tax=Streptomyces himalayensis subsp. aureolus TaxID=2758039 RepID=A0A7W2D014_9ACTN|nr:hypothetical protein [Streptomyces himalayensis]MBA4862280.1 hypothetical protein [Streptomyces himalayensis subsp. aureolus]